MKKLVRVFLAGVMVVVPFAVTIYLIWAIGGWIDDLGLKLVPEESKWTFPGLGAMIVIGGIFIIGLLTHVWGFRWAVGLFEKFFRRVPGIKTVYESVRDLLKLFGSESRKLEEVSFEAPDMKMGRVVVYTPPWTEVGMLAILTNENPVGVGGEGDAKKVAIYVPMAYMIGGPVFYVPADHVKELDIPVEQALKLCTTAQVGATPTPPPTPTRNESQQPQDP